MLRSVLLALLADGKAAHGYALMKAYEERSGFRLSIGNVYRELHFPDHIYDHIEEFYEQKVEQSEGDQAAR